MIQRESNIVVVPEEVVMMKVKARVDVSSGTPFILEVLTTDPTDADPHHIPSMCLSEWSREQLTKRALEIHQRESKSTSK
jgi:hypothetical protein